MGENGLFKKNFFLKMVNLYETLKSRGIKNIEWIKSKINLFSSENVEFGHKVLESALAVTVAKVQKFISLKLKQMVTKT